MALSFRERVALVTGAGNGLGRAYAEELARRGAGVVVNDLGGAVDGTHASTEPAEAVAAAINRLGGTAVADTNSVATADGAAAMIDAAIQRFGRLDIVVNNAGILVEQPLEALSLDSWGRLLGVHLTGTMLVSRAAFPCMKKQGYGRIVNTTSGSALFGNASQSAYAAAKMGVVGLTRVLAIEGAAHGVQANVVAPGALTRMTEQHMAALKDLVSPGPELAAAAVIYLAHESCALNGEVVSSAFGRVSRVFIGTTPGYFNRRLTAEDVQANLAAILDDSGLVFPETVADEIGLILRHYQNAAAPP